MTDIDDLIAEVRRLDAEATTGSDGAIPVGAYLARTECYRTAAPLLAAEVTRLRAALLTRDEATMRQLDAVAAALGIRDRQTYAPDDLGPMVERLRAENARLRETPEKLAAALKNMNLCPTCHGRRTVGTGQMVGGLRVEGQVGGGVHELRTPCPTCAKDSSGSGSSERDAHREQSGTAKPAPRDPGVEPSQPAPEPAGSTPAPQYATLADLEKLREEIAVLLENARAGADGQLWAVLHGMITELRKGGAK